MTIAELIAELQKYPSDMPVLIRDADTDWCITITHFEIGFGKYGEMVE